jgi:conjugal transfer pilus assembly protein TraB
MTRLATLSCISKDGRSIIDQPVKGWVVDKDGRAGMRGKVVAKFGAHVARVAFAGAMKGFGEVFSQTSYVTYSGATGSSRQLKDTDMSTVGQAGAGGSLIAATEDLEAFYLKLAEQTMPVIEVGPTKDLTLAFSEGA